MSLTRTNWTVPESYQPRAVTSETLDHNAREVDRMLDMARGVPEPMEALTMANFSKAVFVAICIGVVLAVVFAMGGV